MMPILLAICFIAAAVALMTSPPLLASCAAWAAMPSVILAFSAFCAIDAVICSIEALVSSTPAACWLAACDSDCAVALTSCEAPASTPTTDCTSRTTADRLRAIQIASPQPRIAITTSNDSIHSLALSVTAVMPADSSRVADSFTSCSLRSPAAMTSSAPLTALSISSTLVPFSRKASSCDMLSA